MYNFVNFLFFYEILRSFLQLQEGKFWDCIQKLAQVFQFFFLVIENKMINFFW